MEKHTKGPWGWMGTLNGKDLIIFQKHDNVLQDVIAINGGEGYIATVHTQNVGLALIESESQANAHLISSAPDMLEALKVARDEIEYMAEKLGNDHTMTLSWKPINDAINKTEGGVK